MNNPNGLGDPIVERIPVVDNAGQPHTLHVRARNNGFITEPSGRAATIQPTLWFELDGDEYSESSEGTWESESRPGFRVQRR
ncbi:MAG: hypothetical protein AMXMBFR78_11440 [Rubrivivax sp.]|jgi:hypothetical protein